MRFVLRIIMIFIRSWTLFETKGDALVSHIYLNVMPDLIRHSVHIRDVPVALLRHPVF